MDLDCNLELVDGKMALVHDAVVTRDEWLGLIIEVPGEPLPRPATREEEAAVIGMVWSA